MKKSRPLNFTDCRYTLSKVFKCGKFILANMFIKFARIFPGNCHQNFADLGQSIEFSLWITRIFGQQSKIVSFRENLWQMMMKTFPPHQNCIVYEFGVAYGNGTKWWLSHFECINMLIGFDTFTGLPRAWRHFPEGSFSTDGIPPNIDDHRVQWVIGKVEKTVSSDSINSFIDENSSNHSCLYLLDLDLYESTRHVLECILPHLKIGDILYFDEAADLDERRAFLEIMGNKMNRFKYIGATPMAMALQVVN